MKQITFFLRSPNLKSKRPIYLSYRFNRNDKFVYPLPIQIESKYWNPKKYRVRDTLAAELKNTINIFLENLENEAYIQIAALVNDKKEITKPALKNILDNYLHPERIKPEEKPQNLHEFIQDYIKRSETKVNPNSGKQLSYYTIRKYYQFYEELKDYEKKFKITLDFDDIDLEFYENFIDMLREKNKANNTIGKHTKVFKAILNEATEKGINTNLKFRSKRFKAFSETGDAIYLNENELQKIYSLDLSKNTKLEKVRDLFIVGSWTGLRFGDFTSIKPEFIIGNFLHIEQHKTLGKITIPLHPIVLEILNKYKGHLPKAISNQKFNEYLKEIGKLAELTEPVYKTITRGGKRISTKYKKWELITTHTARRAFSSNLYKSGFPAKSIMQITGHQTDTSFMKYLKLTPDEHAKLLQQHWQQQGAFLKVAK